MTGAETEAKGKKLKEAVNIQSGCDGGEQKESV